VITRQLRICVVTPLLSGGGSEYQIALLIAALKKHKHHEIYFLAHHVAGLTPPDGATLVPIGRQQRVPRFGYLMDLLPLLQALRQLSPQVIYQRVACGYTGVCAWYARRHNARFIWHVASEDDVTPGASDGGRNFLRHLLEKRSVEYGIRNANRIIVQTTDQARLLERYYSRRATDIIRNFQPPATERLEKSGELTVAWIANLNPNKQPEVFVRLAHSLRDLQSVQFIMAGALQADPRGNPWLRSLLDHISSTENLRFIGGCTQQEVNGLLARSHIFVNTSVREGFPNTFIQSWMRDTVVVSLNVNPDRVLSTELVGICAGDEEALHRIVRQLLHDALLRQQYAQRGRSYALSQHSLRNVERLVSMIDACATEVDPDP
jgi:glycosyltransferase involved in cell wall biosynthesis